MPTIIGRAEQDAAVKKIKASLKEVGVTKDFLDAANPTGEYTISFKGEDNKVHSTAIYAPDKHAVDVLAKAYRKRIADEMLDLAYQNRIELNPSEKAIFGIDDES